MLGRTDPGERVTSLIGLLASEIAVFERDRVAGSEPVWPEGAGEVLAFLEAEQAEAANVSRRAHEARQVGERERFDVTHAVTDYLSMPVALRRAARKMGIPSALDRLPARLREAARVEVEARVAEGLPSRPPQRDLMAENPSEFGRIV